MKMPKKSTPMSIVVLCAAAGGVSATIASTLARDVDGFWAHLGVILLVGIGTGVVTGTARALLECGRKHRP